MMLLAAFYSVTPVMAQKKDKPCMVIGQAKDYLTHVLLDGVRVSLLTTDSMVVDSTGHTSKNQQSSDLTDVYWVTSPTSHMSDMLLKAELEGYETTYVLLPAKTTKARGDKSMRFAPDLLMKRAPKTVSLGEVQVKATKIKFYNKGDTLVFNADAFQLSEGSMLDGLIRQLPGVELKDDGRIYVNGKYVESLLLNGEDFFSKDRQIMLDNLPAYMVKQVKVYDKSSLRGQMLHKKLGDETYVMDVHLKREYNTGWIANAEVGGGTHDRYLARLFALRFTNHSRVSVFGNLNNLNDARRPGESTTWTPDRMPAGEKTQRQAGLDYLVKQKDTKYKLTGSATVAHNDESSLTRQSTLNYLTGGDSWTRMQQQANNHSVSLATSHDWQWTPNRMVSFELEPSFSWQHTRNRSAVASATFNQDPVQYVEDAARLIDSISRPQAGQLLRSIAANRLLNNQLAKSDRVETGTDFSYNQSLAEDLLSSFIFNGNVDYKSNTSNVFSQYRLDYPNQATATTDYRNRYEHGQPNRTLSYSLSPQYEYWFNDIMFIRPAYRLTVEHQHHDYALYRLDQLAGYDAEASTGLGTLPSLSEYERTLDMQNSFWRKQRCVSNQLMLTWSISRWHADDKDLWINVYLPLTYNSYRMDYRRADYDGVFHHHTWQFSPFVIVRKMWDRQQKFVEFRYQLTNETPDLARFIDVRNDADPLNITLGNNGLRDSHTHYFVLMYNGDSNTKQDTHFNVWTAVWLYQNALAMGYTYNRSTGVRVFRPYNVNGNRVLQEGINYATPIGKRKLLSLDTKTQFSFSRSVDLMTVVASASDPVAEPARSVVHNHWFTEDLKLEYKFPWLRLGLNGYVLFNYASSSREGFTTQRVWDFHYGPTLKATLPGKVELATDLSIYSRRGYEAGGANTTDVVWNARLSKTLPKLGLTLLLDGFDMLHQLSNLSVTMNEQGRTEEWRNVLPNYVLFHVIYRFSKKPKRR